MKQFMVDLYSMFCLFVCFFSNLLKIRQTSSLTNNGDQHSMYFIGMCFVLIYCDSSRVPGGGGGGTHI